MGQGTWLFCGWWCHLLTGFGAVNLPSVLFTRHDVSSVRARPQHSCLTLLLPSLGLPCCGVSISTLSFVVAPLVRASLPGGTLSPHSLSRCGVPARLVLTVALSCARPGSLYVPGSKCLAFCSGGYFSPASELDAGGTSAMVLLFIAGIDTHGFNIPRIGVCNHAYRPRQSRSPGCQGRQASSPY
jgi:hypothetical protein